MFLVALQLSEAGGNCRCCMEELSKTSLESLCNPADTLEQCFPTFYPYHFFFHIRMNRFKRVDGGERISIIANLLSRKLVCEDLYIYI
jgi:hypothetical protein